MYLLKDAAGRVIYVGKATNLRSRAGSYFLKAAATEQRTARLVREIRDIEYLDADSEVDALLMEARLIKDIQPKFNQERKDGKSFPYVEVTTREELVNRLLKDSGYFDRIEVGILTTTFGKDGNYEGFQQLFAPA